MDWLDSIGAHGSTNDDYIETLNVPDPEVQWMQERMGKLTGSVLGTLVKRDGKGYKISAAKTAEDLLYKIAWERFIIAESNGLERLSFTSRATDFGHEHEMTALQKFEERTGIQVTPTGRTFIALDEFFGGTPDGFTGDGGIIEAKNPWNGGNHLRTLLTGQIYDDAHFYQMQGYLMLTGRPFCWYVTHDPDLPFGVDLAYFKVEADPELHNAIRDIIDQARKVVEDLVVQVKTKIQ